MATRPDYDNVFVTKALIRLIVNGETVVFPARGRIKEIRQLDTIEGDSLVRKISYRISRHTGRRERYITYTPVQAPEPA